MIASGGDREGERERTAVDVSRPVDGIETGVSQWSRDEPGGYPFTGQVVPGMKAARVRSAASAWNVGRRVPIPSRGVVPGERERVGRQKP